MAILRAAEDWRSASGVPRPEAPDQRGTLTGPPKLTCAQSSTICHTHDARRSLRSQRDRRGGLRGRCLAPSFPVRALRHVLRTVIDIDLPTSRRRSLSFAAWHAWDAARLFPSVSLPSVTVSLELTVTAWLSRLLQPAVPASRRGTRQTEMSDRRLADAPVRQAGRAPLPQDESGRHAPSPGFMARSAARARF